MTNSSFLRCAARLARGGLFFRFPRYRQEKHRCIGRASLHRIRLHITSNSLRARRDAVLCKPRTPGVSAQMQIETDKQSEHIKCTIRCFQHIAEYFVICGDIDADIPDASQRPRHRVWHFDARFSKSSQHTASCAHGGSMAHGLHGRRDGTAPLPHIIGAVQQLLLACIWCAHGACAAELHCGASWWGNQCRGTGAHSRATGTVGAHIALGAWMAGWHCGVCNMCLCCSIAL